MRPNEGWFPGGCGGGVQQDGHLRHCTRRRATLALVLFPVSWRLGPLWLLGALAALVQKPRPARSGLQVRRPTPSPALDGCDGEAGARSRPPLTRFLPRRVCWPFYNRVSHVITKQVITYSAPSRQARPDPRPCTRAAAFRPPDAGALARARRAPRWAHRGARDVVVTTGADGRQRDGGHQHVAHLLDRPLDRGR